MSSSYPSFTPVASFIGGAMLSLSTSALLGGYGRVLGVSGIVSSVSSDPLVARWLLPSKSTPIPRSKIASFCGFLAGGFLLRCVLGDRLESFVGSPVLEPLGGVGTSLGRVMLSGLLVGIGTKLGSGCTSGHMLCGVSRLSYRSIVATATFFSVALITAQVFPSSLLPTPSSFPAFSLSTLLLLQAPLVVYATSPSMLPARSSEILSSFCIGVHFAFGLALAGMLRPSKVISFFYLPISHLPLAATRTWDPSLAMLALGGLLPNALVWQSIKSWATPLWNDKWELPTRRDVDFKLVAGSALFGVGWGLSGLCPGPVLTSLGSLDLALIPFCATFTMGGVIGNIILS